jgi:hypothetical protein
MSIEALSIVLNHSKATGAVKIILMGIANHINPDNDGAWPSQAKLASYANCSERYVHDAVDQLIKLGELKVKTAGGRSKGGNKPNLYWLTISCPEDCDGSTNHRIGKPRTLSHETPNSVQETPNSVAQTLNPSSDEPYIEPLKETVKEPLKRNSKIATELPDDWKPSGKVMALFETEWQVLDSKIQLQKFKSRNRALGQKYKDWDSAFTNWCWNALSYLPADERTIKPKPTILGDWR